MSAECAIFRDKIIVKSLTVKRGDKAFVQDDRKLYGSLFELRVRAFARSSQHRDGAKGSGRDLLRFSLVWIRFYLPSLSERRATDFPWKIVLSARLRASDNRRV